MAKQVKQLDPPTGIAKFFFRLPIWFYNNRMGWIMGKRFLLLNHIGRNSGQSRQVVLEVVGHEQSTDEYIVCVGFGMKSQWYQNLVARPEVTIRVGNQSIQVVAIQLTAEEGGNALVAYSQNNPVAVKFASALGFEVDGTMGDYYDMGTQLVFMKFTSRD